MKDKPNTPEKLMETGNNNIKPTDAQPPTDREVGGRDLLDFFNALAEKLVWIAPVGNGESYQNGQPISGLRGFMVCKRSVNNSDRKNTRVDFLFVEPRSEGNLWKKPFRESGHMFPTIESALVAAARATGLSLLNI